MSFYMMWKVGPLLLPLYAPVHWASIFHEASVAGKQFGYEAPWKRLGRFYVEPFLKTQSTRFSAQSSTSTLAESPG